MPSSCRRCSANVQTAAPRPRRRNSSRVPTGSNSADAVLVVRPYEHVRGEPSVGSLDDAVERAAIRPLGHDVRVARLGDARGRPDVAVDRNALGEVLRLDRAVTEAVRQRRRLGCVRDLAVLKWIASPGFVKPCRASAARASSSSSYATASSLPARRGSRREAAGAPGARRARAGHGRPSATTRRRRGRPRARDGSSTRPPGPRAAAGPRRRRRCATARAARAAAAGRGPAAASLR